MFSIGSRIGWQDEDHFFVTLGMAGSPVSDMTEEEAGQISILPLKASDSHTSAISSRKWVRIGLVAE